MDWTDVVGQAEAEMAHGRAMRIEAALTCRSPDAAQWYAGYIKGIAWMVALIVEGAVIDLREVGGGHARPADPQPRQGAEHHIGAGLGGDSGEDEGDDRRRQQHG